MGVRGAVTPKEELAAQMHTATEEAAVLISWLFHPPPKSKAHCRCRL